MGAELSWICLIGTVPLVGIIVIATVVKLIEVQRTQQWQETTATIVRSKTDIEETLMCYPVGRTVPVYSGASSSGWRTASDPTLSIPSR